MGTTADRSEEQDDQGNNGGGGESRTEKAEQRTEWAEHRTLLANERTFSAWLRTGLSAIGGGLAVAQLLTDDESGIAPRIIGALLVLFGTSVSLLAFWRYRQISDVLESDNLRIAPLWAMSLLVGIILLVVVLVLWLIFVQ